MGYKSFVENVPEETVPSKYYMELLTESCYSITKPQKHCKMIVKPGDGERLKFLTKSGRPFTAHKFR